MLRGARVERSAKKALSDLVLAVEISLFGERAITRDDYERCTESYRIVVSTSEVAA